METSASKNYNIQQLNYFYSQVSNSRNSRRSGHDNNDRVRMTKSNPRKCKIIYNIDIESPVKKASSLYNISYAVALRHNVNADIKETMKTIPIGFSLQNGQIADNDLLCLFEKQKRSHQSEISELILAVESRKREKENLSLENKRLTETIQNLQMNETNLQKIINRQRSKLIDLGAEIGMEDATGMTNESGDGSTVHSCAFQSFVTLGDDESVSSVSSLVTIEHDILDTLSVSTLQDRILKMEEDSYCTTEELQAAMQELTDLQNSLEIANEENRRLTFDRSILHESNYEQTQKLQKNRAVNNNLKFLLLSNNLQEYSMLDEKLRELYVNCEFENSELLEQIEMFRHGIFDYQEQCKQFSLEFNIINQKLDVELKRNSQLEEKYRSELWQREQIENVLKSFSELFGKTEGWSDCISGVLSVIELSKRQKKDIDCNKNDIKEKEKEYEELRSKLKKLEECVCLGMKSKDEYTGSITQLQKKLEISHAEIAQLSGTIDHFALKYQADVGEWRSFRNDLLTSVAAANFLREEKEKECIEFELQIKMLEQSRKDLLDRVDSLKSLLKDRATINREQNSISNTSNVKDLIKSLEFKIKPGSSDFKPHQNSPNTTNTLANDINQLNTIHIDLSSSNDIPDFASPKSSIVAKENCLNLILPLPEFSQTLSPPPQVANNTASSVLESLSRRNSVITNPLLDSHSHSRPPSPEPLAIDPIVRLVKSTNKGSKRNALLYWCQLQTAGYPKIDITNFSSSWNDGLALCALLFSLDSELVNFPSLAESTSSSNPEKNERRNNFQAAFSAADSIGIPRSLDIETMVNTERPLWNLVYQYVADIYLHFESLSSNFAPPHL